MMLHKLRATTVRPARSKLSCIVEVDETYIGGAKPGKRGRGAAGKVIVIGAVDVRDKYANRVRFRVIPNVTSSTLINFIKANVEKGATVITDDWHGYSGLAREWYNHIVGLKLPHTYRALSNLKIWLLGTQHGSVRP